jgi:hypothetical protein
MPTISSFHGVLIRMFWAEHPPPHFHAQHSDDEAVIDIASLNVVAGALPPRILRLTLRWAELHREELLENWSLCAKRQSPKAIIPLP